MFTDKYVAFAAITLVIIFVIIPLIHGHLSTRKWKRALRTELSIATIRRVLLDKGVDWSIVDGVLDVTYQMVNRMNELAVGEKTIDYYFNNIDTFTLVLSESDYEHMYKHGKDAFENEVRLILISREETLEDETKHIISWSTEAKKAEYVMRTWVSVVIMEHLLNHSQ